MNCKYKIEMSDDVEESVEVLQKEMNEIRKEMAKGQQMNVNVVDKYIRTAMREVKGIKAELSTLPKSQTLSINIDEYQNELNNITIQLSNNNTQRNITHNDVCMLLKQPNSHTHVHKPKYSSITKITTKRIIILLSLLIIVMIIYVYIYVPAS